MDAGVGHGLCDRRGGVLLMSVAEPLPREPQVVPRLRPFAILTGPVLGLAGVLLLFIVLIGTHSKADLDHFLSRDNAQIVAQEATIPAVVALGALIVIVSGGIDLSVGSIVALVSVVTMQVYRHLYRGPESIPAASVAAVTAGVVSGGICGL